MAVGAEAECTEAEIAALVGAMSERKLTRPHLEIGTAAGGTLKRMLLAYPSTERPKFVVVDPLTYFPRQREAIEANLASAGIDPRSVEFRVETSAKALKKALRAQESFDFILIDGNHSLRPVTEDLRWTRLLVPGGFVCLHDYEHLAHVVVPGVKIALDRFLARHVNYQLKEVVGAMAVVRKLDWGDLEIGHGALAEATVRQVAWKWSHSLRKRLCPSYRRHSVRH
jgi:predicted O-methyltransferase YrrM